MYELAQVEQVQLGEEIFQVEPITVLIEPIVIDHIGGNIVIDHKNNYGYILKTDFEILTFGMKLVK